MQQSATAPTVQDAIVVVCLMCLHICAKLKLSVIVVIWCQASDQGLRTEGV